VSLAGPADYARACVEALVAGAPVPGTVDAEWSSQEAACFVSIKKDGDLRGCIGTLLPAECDLATEIARNAGGAAFHDPRFASVQPRELDRLSYSVDVLSPPEHCERSDLDPARWGVIVSLGFRRGVLLPDLPGVNDVEHQLLIALQKAGIAPDEPYEIQRFSVRRYREGDSEGMLCGGEQGQACDLGCGREDDTAADDAHA
jgi:AmmeMemoRadiSam system protein A